MSTLASSLDSEYSRSKNVLPYTCPTDALVSTDTDSGVDDIEGLMVGEFIEDDMVEEAPELESELEGKE